MADPQYVGRLAVVFSAVSALAWGVGDFSGGLASKRARPLDVMPISTSVGLLVLAIVAIARRSPMVTSHDALFAFLAGVFGAVGTLGLYQALANGKMGLAAPLTAAIANAIALCYGALTEGLPRPLQALGFLLAILAVWCIARAREDKSQIRQHRGWLLPAILSGVGFGLFFSFNAQFTATDISWAVVETRVVTVCLIVVVALVFSRPAFRWTAKTWVLVLMAGATSALGDLSFALATRFGRLDVGAVLSSLYPLVTVGLAMLIIRERLTREQWVGVALALGSVVLIEL